MGNSPKRLSSSAKTRTGRGSRGFCLDGMAWWSVSVNLSTKALTCAGLFFDATCGALSAWPATDTEPSHGLGRKTAGLPVHGPDRLESTCSWQTLWAARGALVTGSGPLPAVADVCPAVCHAGAEPAALPVRNARARFRHYGGGHRATKRRPAGSPRARS